MLFDASNYRERAISAACRILDANGVVAVPTETVYGLAANATNAIALKKLYQLKRRPARNPLICHVADVKEASKHGAFDPISRKLAEAFWPGPLTIVLPLSERSGIDPIALAGLQTVALRVPRGLVRDIIVEARIPLAIPSANLSGRVSGTLPEHIADDFGERVPIVTVHTIPLGLESTVVQATVERVTILRPGAIALRDIAAVLERTSVTQARSEPEALISPGMMSSHYAPSANVRLNAEEAREGEAFVGFGSIPAATTAKAAKVFNLSPDGKLEEAAANLFLTMRYADKLGLSTIAFSPIPNVGLGVAINERLDRAAAPRPNWSLHDISH